MLIPLIFHIYLLLNFLCEKAPVKMLRIGIEDKFGKSGTPAALLEEYGLTKENIIAKVEAFVK